VTFLDSVDFTVDFLALVTVIPERAVTDAEHGREAARALREFGWIERLDGADVIGDDEATCHLQSASHAALCFLTWATVSGVSFAAL
jgi:hypothetical protein